MATFVFPCPAWAQTLARHPQNPRVLLYQGRPIVLVTATEHYGAVLNGTFDYVTYLNELSRHKLNLSRAFTFYREREDSIASLGFANTLAPRLGREVLPWRRVGPGRALDGGLKFDLKRWNPVFFSRFKDFLREAARREIIVEVVLFCNPYRESILSWLPCHRENNINGVGGRMTHPDHFFQIQDPTVFEFQEAFVRKMVQELNSFDNLYFEILNEGKARVRDASDRLRAWQLAMCDVIREEERGLAKRHLIAVNAHEQVLLFVQDGRHYLDIGDVSYLTDARVDIVNYHYLSRRHPGRDCAVYYPLKPPEGAVGNIWAFLKSRAHFPKPIVFDENYAGVVGGSPENWERNRLEAWETLLGGGVGFDHLDWSFTPEDPSGAGKSPIGDGRRLDGRRLRAQLGALAALWRDCGPERMAPDYELVISTPAHTLAFASRRADRERYVVYIADSRGNDRGFGEPLGGEVTLRLPKGRYHLQTMHSKAVEWRLADAPVMSSGRARVPLPKFRWDCALVLQFERSRP